MQNANKKKKERKKATEKGAEEEEEEEECCAERRGPPAGIGGEDCLGHLSLESLAHGRGQSGTKNGMKYKVIRRKLI